MNIILYTPGKRKYILSVSAKTAVIRDDIGNNDEIVEVSSRLVKRISISGLVTLPSLSILIFETITNTRNKHTTTLPYRAARTACGYYLPRITVALVGRDFIIARGRNSHCA